MKCGYYTYGALSADEGRTVQPNGKIESSIWYRELQLDYLYRAGHELVIMNDKRAWHKSRLFNCLQNTMFISPGNFKIDWVKLDDSISLEETWIKMHKDIKKHKWPKLDLLIIDNAGYPLFPIFTYKLMLMLAYKDRCPVILLDDDNHTEKIFPRFSHALGFDISKEVYVATRYKKKNFQHQLFFPLPYDESKEWPLIPSYNRTHDLVYIGHDYDRREKMIEFFFNFATTYPEYKVEIYGNWEKWLATKKYAEKYPKEVLKGPIAQYWGFDTLNKALATCKVIPKWAEDYGHITGGFHEAVMVGCPLLADKAINTIEEYILKDNLVSCKEDVFKKLEEFKSQSFQQKQEMIEEQRKIFRKFKIDVIFENMLKEVFK